MSYSNKVTINGFEIIFKRMEGNFGVFLNLDNELIKTAISECSLLFFNTFFGNELLSMRETFEALECFCYRAGCLEQNQQFPPAINSYPPIRKLTHV
jgi:hypothetical protein